MKLYDFNYYLFYIKMLFLFVFISVCGQADQNSTQLQNVEIVYTSVTNLKVTDFEEVFIHFMAKPEAAYLTFQGDKSRGDHLYLHSKDSQFILWVLQGESHEFYVAPYSNELLFGWPNYTINHKPMKLSLFGGPGIVLPMRFDKETFMAPILGILANNITSLINKSNENDLTQIEKVYKCPPPKTWVTYIMLVIIAALVIVLLITKHELIKALLGSKISWLIQRAGAILSGGFEVVPSDNTEEDSGIPEKPRRVHIAQTYT